MEADIASGIRLYMTTLWANSSLAMNEAEYMVCELGKVKIIRKHQMWRTYLELISWCQAKVEGLLSLKNSCSVQECEGWLGLITKGVFFTWSVLITPHTMQGLLCALWHTSKHVLFAGLDRRGLLCTCLHPRQGKEGPHRRANGVMDESIYQLDDALRYTSS